MSGRATLQASVACLCLAVVPWPAEGSVRVRTTRVGMDPQHTRLVWESDAPIQARLDHDHTGERLIVDLGDLAQGPALAGIVRQIGTSNPFVASAAVRSRAGDAQLELVLRRKAATRLFHLAPDGGHGDRLVLDLYAAADDDEATSYDTDEAPPHDAHPVHVTQVRAAVARDRVRLVLESDRRIQAQVLRPTEPGALAVELGDVVLDEVLAGLPQKIRRNPYLSAVHLERDGTGTKIVLVATGPVEPQIFNLPAGEGHGERLVVDIFPQLPLPAPSPSPAAETDAGAGHLVATPAPVPSAPAPPAPPADASNPPSEAWLEVHLNGARQDTVLVLEDGNDVLVNARDLEHWRVRNPVTTGITRGSERYVRLSAIPRIRYRVDPAQGTLTLEVPAELLETSHLSGVSRGTEQPVRSAPGAYFNYDVFAGRGQAGPTHASTLLETGLFGRWGSGSSTTLVRHADGRTHGVRLDTTWIYDRPDRMASFRLGDGISGASSWGRAVRVGGVQWATDCATQPGFITFPLPTLSGVATTPSTVEYYVNDTLRLRRNVPDGPFAIQDLPGVTGQGDIRMVVRDMLGREQVVTQPFYASGAILAPGLRDFSYEAGFVRENYGLASNDYGRLAVAGTERRGFSDRFTGELHAEAVGGQQTLGLGANLLAGNAGILSASVAGSRSGQGSGGLVGIGFRHQSRYLGYGFQSQWTSPRFAQLGYQAPDRPPRQTTSGFLSLSQGRS
jgi:outer membrane usher protein